MKPRWLMMLAALLLLGMGGSAFATDTYFAQASAGSGSGADCADAKAVSGWASSFGPGNTQHLCGAITSALTAGGSGSSGNPDTILFESGASLNITVCSSQCLDIHGKSWIVVDGGTNGIIESTASGNLPYNLNGSSYSCNGTTCTITGSSSNPQLGVFTSSDGVGSAYDTVVLSGLSQSSLNATVTPTSYTGCNNSGYTTPCSASFSFAAPGGFSGSGSLTSGQAGVLCPSGSYCTTEGNTIGINASPCNNCIIRNLTFSDLFWEWCPTCAGRANFGVTAAIWTGGNSSGSYLSIHNNVCHDARACVAYTPSVSSDNALSCGNTVGSDAAGVWDNNFYNADGMNFENNGVSSSGVCFHDNQVHDPINWDSADNWGLTGANCDYHHDGIHFWGLTGGVTTGSQIYNNYFSGAWGVCPTGAIFLEGRNDASVIFNNTAANMTYKQEQNGIFNFNGEGTQQYYNNTIIGANSASFNGESDLCLNFGTPAGTFTLKAQNNLTIRCNTILEIQNSPTFSSVDYNAWGECTPSSGVCNGGDPFVINGSFDTFSGWQAAAGDSHGQYNATSGHYNLVYSTGQPNSGSAVIEQANNLTSLSIANLDSGTSLGNTITPIARPSGTCSTQGTSTCWDEGAYPYVVVLDPLTVNVYGSGTVASSPAGISCPPTCTANFTSGTTPVLTATPNSGYAFAGWTGINCTGISTCATPITAAETFGATFQSTALWNYPHRSSGHELDCVQVNSPVGVPYVAGASSGCGTIVGGDMGSIPSMAGGYNTTVTMLDFGAPVVRLTDATLNNGVAGSGQGWIDSPGGSDFSSLFEMNDTAFIVTGVADYSYAYALSPTSGQNLGQLWPGSSGHDGYHFNGPTFSRLVPYKVFDFTQNGKYNYYFTNDGGNSANCTNANVGYTVTNVPNCPLPYNIADLNSSTDACFGAPTFPSGNPDARARFYPMQFSTGTAQSTVLSIDGADGGLPEVLASPKHCWHPSLGFSDWQPNAAYTTTSCGGISGTCTGIVPTGGDVPTSLTYNAGNFAYSVSGACTTGSTQPSWSTAQTVGATLVDGSCTWTAAAHSTSGCAGQGYGTLTVHYNLTTGQCTIKDNGNGHVYVGNNYTNTPLVDDGFYTWFPQATPSTPSATVDLYTDHQVTATKQPGLIQDSESQCIGQRNVSTGAYTYGTCQLPTNSQGLAWYVNSGTVYAQAAYGHDCSGWLLHYGVGTFPILNSSAFTLANVTANSWLPQTSGTLAPNGVNVPNSYASGNLPGQHMNCNYDPSFNQDNTVVNMSTYNDESNFNGFDGAQSGFTFPLMSEIDLYDISGTYAFPLREVHTIISNTSEIFNGRYGSLTNSSSGRFVMWTSNWGNSLGTGVNANNCNTGATTWQASTFYALGTILTPVFNNYPTQLNYGSNAFIVTTAGTSGATPPAWNSIAQPNTGTTISDGTGTLVWTSNGTNNCRVDVFLAFLSRGTAASTPNWNPNPLLMSHR